MSRPQRGTRAFLLIHAINSFRVFSPTGLIYRFGTCVPGLPTPPTELVSTPKVTLMITNNLDEIKAAIQKLSGPDRQTLQAWLATTSSGTDDHSSAYDADILYDRVSEPAEAY